MNSGNFGYGSQNFDSGYQYVKSAPGSEGWTGGEAPGSQLPLPPKTTAPASRSNETVPQHGIIFNKYYHYLEQSWRINVKRIL